MDNEFQVGDLVQYVISPRSSLYYTKYWQYKVGVVTNIRKVKNIAYVKWSDPDANDTWISYDDLKLLNREHKSASETK